MCSICFDKQSFTSENAAIVDGGLGNGGNYSNNYINSLVWDGGWSGTVNYTIDDGYYGGDGFAAPIISAIHRAYSSYEKVCGIDFNYVSVGDANVDIIFFETTNAYMKMITGLDWVLGVSEVPGESDIVYYDSIYGVNRYLFGDDVICTGISSTMYESFTHGYNTFQKGGYDYVTIIHEIGHSLGLAHPHDNGGDSSIMPGVDNSGDKGDNNLNQGIFTTMSYIDGYQSLYPDHNYLNHIYYSNDIAEFGYQATPMAFDIAALQELYGTTSNETGDNTYTLFSSNTPGATWWECIWDTGGTDKISNYGVSTACTIDLTAATLINGDAKAGGAASYVSGVVGGFTIANGVIIENADGGNGNDTLIGNNSDNILNGYAGNDTMIGGQGNDTYYVDSVLDYVDENNGEGTDTIISTISFSLSSIDQLRTSASIENLTLSGSSNINGTGNGLDNIITGNSGDNILIASHGNDTLISNGGNDRLDGWYGNDNYYLSGELSSNSSGLHITGEVSGGGTDTIYSTARVNLNISSVDDYQSYSWIENIVLQGSSNISADGNDLDNNISGNSGNNVLSGNGGNDILRGFAGNDVFSDSEGTNYFYGGLGNDVYWVAATGDYNNYHIELENEGTDIVYSGATTHTLAGNIENLWLTYRNTTSQTGIGNNLDNYIYVNNTYNDYVTPVTLRGLNGNDTLVGGLGSDILDGGSGNDNMSGGLGDDIYIVDSSSDVVTESSGQGTDTVKSSSISLSLANYSNVENLTLAGSANLNLTGNSGDNILTGNSGNNTIIGGAGTDTVVFASNQNDYLFKKIKDGYLVKDNSDSDGIDTIQSCETLNFLDSSGVNLSTINTFNSSTDFNKNSFCSDILWANTSGHHYMWLMEDGSKSSAINLGVVGSGWAVKSTNDFDGDGDADILWANTSGHHYMWLMEDGSKSSAINLGVVGSGWAVKSTNDFDGDGDADILWANTSGHHYMWLMEDGSKSSAINLGVVGSGWAVKSTNDFDGDGDADILWANTSGHHYMWLMEDGSKSSAINLGVVGSGWAVKSTNDFDGDGDADILWANTSGHHYMWLMEDGSKSSAINLGVVGSGWAVKSTNDFDGDGDADILWANTSGHHYMWLMEDGSKSSAINLGVVGSGWAVKSTNDFDGDGDADILWANTSGHHYMWLMEDGSKSSAINLGVLGSGWGALEENELLTTIV